MAVSPTKAPAATAVTIPAETESWYITPGPVPRTGPSPPVPPTNPYRAGTLHVGVSGGNETARTYVRLNGALLGTSDIEAGSLLLPVDPGDGTVAPETAQLAVCFAPDPGAAVDGSFSPPPAADCSRSVAARYEPAPAPHFVADLAGIGLDAVRDGGFAVLPSPAAAASRATWHVAFYTQRTAPAPDRAIHADVLVAESVADAVTDGFDGDATFALEETPTHVGGPDFAALPLVSLFPQPPTSPPLLADEAPAAGGGDGVVPLANVSSSEFAYPTVLLLPLLLLSALGVLASALTRQPVVVAYNNDGERSSR